MPKLLFSLIALLSLHVHAETKTLVIIGDSLTEGYGVARQLAYPTLLQTAITKGGKDWRVINAGISGSTSASAPSRVQWHLKQKPDLILLALGANDGLRGLDVKAMELNLDKAIETAKKAGVPIVLAGIKVPPNYGGKYAREFEQVFPRLGEKHKLTTIPFLLDKVAAKKDLNLADGIHPNEKGHAIMAQTVYAAIKKLL